MHVATVQDQVDFMVKRFQEAIGKFETLSSSVKQSLDSFAELKFNVNSIAASHKNLTEMVELLQNQVTQGTFKTNQQQTNLSQIVSSITAKHDSMKNEIAGFNQQVGNLTSQILNLASLQKDFVKSSVVNDLAQSIETLKHKLSDCLLLITDSVKSSSDNINKVKDFANSLSHDLVSNKNTTNIHASTLTSLANELAQLKHTASSGLQDVKNSLTTQLNEKIAAIPKPAIPSLDEAKKQLQAQLEPISLDAKNAHLRSTNTETKVSILEKRLEQLQLLVNKMQLKG